LSKKPKYTAKITENCTNKINEKSKYLCKYVPEKWIQRDLENINAVPFPNSDYSRFQDLSNVKVFEQLFINNIFEF